MSFNFYHIRSDDFTAHSGGDQEVVINRDNYEAYFVMYVDNELNAAERKAVEQFIQQNPDLEEEMVMLQQSVLRPNDDIVFEPKEVLYKGATEPLHITEQNCEEYFVLYGDDELTNAEKEKVEQFVYHHPQYQAEFELIQQVKLVPDNSLSFPDKAYLYRTEEDDDRVIAFPWWRFSAAAITLLVIGSLAWFIASHTGKHEEVAGATPSVEKNNEIKTLPQVISPDNSEIIKADNAVANTETPAPENSTNGIKQPVETIVTVSNKKNISEPSNKLQPSYVKQESDQQPPAQDPENNDVAVQPKMIAVVVNNTYEPAVKSSPIKGTRAPIVVQTVAYKTEDASDSTYVLNAPINKTPLRGFFRKISRVVDKVTNPEENGKKGIRIANLEIALN
jgi:hypothetical protein